MLFQAPFGIFTHGSRTCLSSIGTLNTTLTSFERVRFARNESNGHELLRPMELGAS